MSNRYCNLVGTNKVKDEYSKVNVGFENVQQEVDEIVAEVEAHKTTDSTVHSSEKISYNDSNNTKVKGSNLDRALASIEQELKNFIAGDANAEVGSAHTSTARDKTFEDIDERFEETELESINSNLEITESKTSISKGITFNKLVDRLDDIESDIESVEDKVVNPSQYITNDSISAAKLKTASDSDKIGLNNLKQEVIQAIAGTAQVNAIPTNESVTLEKLAPSTIAEFIDKERGSYTVYTSNDRPIYLEEKGDKTGVYLNIHTEGFRIVTLGSNTQYYFADLITQVGELAVTSQLGVNNCLFIATQKHLVLDLTDGTFKLVTINNYNAVKHVSLLQVIYDNPYSGLFIDVWIRQKTTANNLGISNLHLGANKQIRAYVGTGSVDPYIEEDTTNKKLYLKLAGSLSIRSEIGDLTLANNTALLTMVGVSGVTSPKGVTNCLEIPDAYGLVLHINGSEPSPGVQLSLVTRSTITYTKHVELLYNANGYMVSGNLLEPWTLSNLRNLNTRLIDTTIGYAYNDKALYLEPKGIVGVYIKFGSDGFRTVVNGVTTTYTLATISSNTGRALVTSDRGVTDCLYIADRELLVFNKATGLFSIIGISTYREHLHYNLLLVTYGKPHSGLIVDHWRAQVNVSGAPKEIRAYMNTTSPNPYIEEDTVNKKLYIKILTGTLTIYSEIGTLSVTNAQLLTLIGGGITSPLGVTSCVELTDGQSLVFHINGSEPSVGQTVSIINRASVDSTRHVELLYNKDGYSVSGLFLKPWEISNIKRLTTRLVDTLIGYAYNNKSIYIEPKPTNVGLYLKFDTDGFRTVVNGVTTLYSMGTISTDTGRDLVTSVKGVSNCLYLADREHLVFNKATGLFSIINIATYREHLHYSLLLCIYEHPISGVIVDHWRAQQQELALTSNIVNVTNFRNLKDHYIDNIKPAIAKINNLADINTLAFSIVTDVHYISGRENALEQCAVMGSLTDYVDLDFLAITGDFIPGSETKEVSLHDINEVMVASQVFSKVPVLACRGNHDWNNFEQEGTDEEKLELIITNKEFYQVVTKKCEKHGIIQDQNYKTRGYFYKDFEDKKIRAIFLNVCEVVEVDGIVQPDYTYSGSLSPEQQQWYGSVALDLSDKTTPSDWGVMVFSHWVPYTEDYIHDYGPTVTDLITITDAFRNGTSVVVDGVTYNFTQQGASNFIMFTGGHVHMDAHAKVNGINYFVNNSTYAVQKYTSEPISPVREDDGPTTLSLNIFTINPTTRTVNVTKAGSGQDWEFTY